LSQAIPFAELPAKGEGLVAPAAAPAASSAQLEGGNEGSAPPSSSAGPPPALERKTLPSQAPLEIGGLFVAAGERKEVLLSASETFSAADVNVHVAVIRGAHKGPTLCLTAGIHGDELNGVAIVRELLDQVSADELHGTVIGVPIVNPFGFWAQSRYLPDRRDLNRYFPGNKSGSIASRIAGIVWNQIIRHCKYLIDFHTGTLHRANLPQIRADLRIAKIAKIARAFEPEVLIHNAGIKGTLRRVAADAGIPAILYEAGESLRFQRVEIDRGIAGILRVMKKLKMVVVAPPSNQPTVTYLETHWVRAPAGGILEYEVGLGDQVERGQRIGIIADPLRRIRGDVISNWRGRIVGEVLAPVVIPGIAVVHIGVPGGHLNRVEASSDGNEELELEQPE